MKEKRTAPRFGPLVVKAQIELDGKVSEGYLTNLSESGAFLAIDEPPPVGAVVHLRAPLPWNLGELRGHARIVWKRAPDSPASHTRILGVGLAFSGLADDVQRALEAYLARFAELASQID